MYKLLKRNIRDTTVVSLLILIAGFFGKATVDHGKIITKIQIELAKINEKIGTHKDKESSASVLTTRVLRVGCPCNWAPFAENGAGHSGFDIELLNIFAKEYNLEIHWSDKPKWSDLHEGLMADKYDITTAASKKTTRDLHGKFVPANRDILCSRHREKSRSL